MNRPLALVGTVAVSVGGLVGGVIVWTTLALVETLEEGPDVYRKLRARRPPAPDLDSVTRPSRSPRSPAQPVAHRGGLTRGPWRAS